jgi:hypothetical protein
VPVIFVWAECLVPVWLGYDVIMGDSPHVAVHLAVNSLPTHFLS